MKSNNCVDSLTNNRRSIFNLAFFGAGCDEQSTLSSFLIVLEQPGSSKAFKSGQNSEASDAVSSLEAEDTLKQVPKFLATRDCATDFSVSYSFLRGLTNFRRVFPPFSMWCSDHFAGRVKLFC